MSQYIGKTISLVSNKGLRYVGLLDKISAEDATVSLKSVRLFGTEGRMAEQGQPSMEVMPGTDIYEYVVFRGSDVKDLSVLDIPIDQVQPVVYYPPSAASAAQETSAQNAAVQTPAPTAAPSAVNSAAAAASREDYVQHTTRDAVAAQNQAASVSASPAGRESAARETGRVSGPSSTSSSHVTDAPRATPTTTDGQVASKTSEQAPRERDAPAPAPAPKQDFNTAFDFEEANSRFEKERGPQDAANKPTYDKKSLFFDTISLNEHQQRNNMRWHEEKNLNMDTFGEAYAHRGGRGNYRGNRGGRGRGNGYRGGRGRGNYRGRGSSEPKPEWA